VCGVGAGFLASYIAVVQQIGDVSSGGYFLIFWMFQNPPDLLFSCIKGMANGEVDGAQHRARAPDRDGRHADLLGLEPEGPDRGLGA
jgi:hypothetical protein